MFPNNICFMPLYCDHFVFLSFCLTILFIQNFLFPLRSAQMFLKARNKHRANKVDSTLRLDRVAAFL